jgi:magnesium transporter
VPPDSPEPDPLSPAGAVRVEDPAVETPEDLRVEALLRNEFDAPELAQAVEEQEPADAAETLERLDEGEAADVLEEMGTESAAEALAHMLPALGVSVLEDLIEEDPAYAGQLIEEMAPDDATELLRELPDGYRDRLLGTLGKVEAVKYRRLLDYDEHTAGGMMNSEYLHLRDTQSVAEAIEIVRRAESESECIEIYVVDWTGKLLGKTTMRGLLLARPDRRIAEIMATPVDAVQAELDRQSVAQEFRKYDYLTLPVVDEQGRLLGVITFDDVLDTVAELGTEDAQAMVGAGKEEAVFSSTRQKFRSRFPWLVVNLFTSSVSALVVLMFEGLIAQIALLAVIMPVIANQSGNAGQQSLAVTLRGIVLDQVRSTTAAALVLREAIVGFLNGSINGLLIGAVVAVGGHLLHPGEAKWQLGVVVAIAMSVALTVGCTVGASIPLVLRRFGLDPATASTIFLTMVTDSVSFLVFLGLAAGLSAFLG